MPHHFTFKDFAANRTFECDILSQRCDYQMPTGRCKNLVAMGTPVCWIHLKYKYFVQIKDSGVRGKGVFCVDHRPQAAARPIAVPTFRRGDIIIPYAGEPMSRRILSRRYGNNTAPYALVKDNGTVEDGAC